MSLQTISADLGFGGAHQNDQMYNAIKELQGLNLSLVAAGAKAGVKMNVAAMRSEDTLLAVFCSASGVLTSKAVADCTISSTKAVGTITMTDNPADAGTVTVNGNVYVFKTTPTGALHVLIGAGEEATGDNLAAAINAYENRRTGGAFNTPAVVATSDGAGVVTVTSVVDGAGNGPVVTETGSEIVVSSTAPEAVTATLTSVVEDTAIIVNGVTFTAKDAPAEDSLVEFNVEASDALQAIEIARVVNRYMEVYGTLDVVASYATNVVTFRPFTARAGNIIGLTESATNLTVSGSGYLAGGTATGGFSSSTDLDVTGASGVIVAWFNKR